jgi:hypothetical protein
MTGAYKASFQMMAMSLAGFSLSKTDIRFVVEMICLITPVVLSILVFIRNGKKKKDKNDTDSQ